MTDDFDAELTSFLKKAAESITNQAALLKPDLFDVGVGAALSTGGDYLTVFIKSDPEDQGYALALCLEQAAAAKMIQGLIAGYRHLYFMGEEGGDDDDDF